MYKKIISVFCAVVLVISAFSNCIYVNAMDSRTINTYTELKTAVAAKEAMNCELKAGKTFYINDSLGIAADMNFNGNNAVLEALVGGYPATLYQNEYVHSSFNSLTIKGNSKNEVGIWVGAGNMVLNSCKINNYSIYDLRQSAFAVGSNGILTLNDTTFDNNSLYDIGVFDCGILNINKDTVVNNVRVGSNFAEINIGDNWSGSFCITFDSPVKRTLGKVGNNADISGIRVTNDGYFVENLNGNLVVKSDKERAIRFDLSKREKLYKGSTGFLYGSAEINVPSVDLLYGLKPNTMVQKALGGLQHPTGDATRTKSSLLCAGAEDMQIYFQDMYLEWPYDAPMSDGNIDVESYKNSVVKLMQGMVCNQETGELDTDVASKFSYVIFNEPDQIWYGGKLKELEKAWKQVYTAVREVDPNARCVGPNYSGFNAEHYEDFIKYCYENDCLPQLISWHELGDIFMTDFYDHYDFVMGLVDKYYKDSPYQPQLIVNEYARHYDIGSVGGLVKWLAMFEDKDMSGCLAYWAMANSLNELAADQNSPTAGWWVYHWYAQMTGEQCPLTAPSFRDTRFYGVTSYDSDINMAYCLFGGSEDVDGTEVVYLDNLSSTALANSSGAVNVKLYATSFSGQQGSCYKPECIFDGAVMPVDDSVRLQVNNTDEMDAYFAIITKPEDSAIVQNMDNTQISTLSYEAENAKLSGGATAYRKTGWTAFATSGRMDVGSINNNGDGVEFDVNVTESGTYTASLFYSLQSPFVNPQTLEPDANGQNRGIGKMLPFGISVDGNKLPDIYLESTVTWYYKNHCDVELDLTAGNHTITFTHINGNEGDKGNLQLVAAIDKLDIIKTDKNSKNDFDINLSEMKNFMTNSGYKVTAIAPEAGYYAVKADCDIELSKQSIDYAKDAKTYSEISTYDIPVGDVVYLSKGANTLIIKGYPNKISFVYDGEKTLHGSTVISADDFTLHGTNPVYKANAYAQSGKVVSEIGIGQSPESNESGDKNYITFKVNADKDGVYNLAIRYSNDEPAPVMLKADGSTYIHPYNIDLVERYAQICVNDKEPETAYFRNTLSWDTFRTLDVQVELKKGENTIKIYNDNSYHFSPIVNSTAPEIDNITICSLSYGNDAVVKIPKDNVASHSFGDSTVRRQPSCSLNGISTCTCTICGYIKNESIPTLPHNFSGNASNCYVCGALNPDYVAPVITTKQPDTTTTTSTTTTTQPTTKAPAVSKPKTPSIKKLTAGKKQFKLTWKAVSGITGYQVQYSTDKKFKKDCKTVTVKGAKKTSTTVKKLKPKKTYYVRLRTYKGKTYSSWSKAKTIKVK